MKSLIKVLEILKLFLEYKQEMSLGEISKLTNINKTTVHRILSTLVKYNYLYQQEDRGRYSLGTIYLDFSGLIKRGQRLRNVALPILAKLSREVNEPVPIAFIEGAHRIYTESVHGESRPSSVLQVAIDEGSSLPLYCTCLGKIVLADMSYEELKNYFLKVKPVRHTPNTIFDLHKMDKHLVKVRKEGIAFDYEEFELGVSGVAVKLEFNGKLLGAIAIVAPLIRLPKEKIQKLIPMIKGCATSITMEYSRNGYVTFDEKTAY